MKQDSDLGKLNKNQIELHLKSAVDTLTPDVFNRIDLSARQRERTPEDDGSAYQKVLRLQRRMRGFAVAAAACICLVAMGGGAYQYRYLNRAVDSVIGIDVNPSVELSVNRKNRVLKAEALNTDAQQILSEMDLEGVELNVAVNAVIGSMVTHGYLDDLDNAILVTVSNDSMRKATELRASVVDDIEKTLEENQVQAVVYDQQVIEKDEMKELAREYGISYGKAYFLKELIDQNPQLTMDDMDELSSMSMEEIAGRIAESSLALGEFADRGREPAEPATVAGTTALETTEATAEAVTEATTEAAASDPAMEPEPTTARLRTATAAEAETEEPEEVEAGRVDIDYVDYDIDDGLVYVYFVTFVDWKNPTVSVRDEDGNHYAAYVEDTYSDECTISAEGLEGGKSYTFVLGGLTPKEGGRATTVTGYFDKPEIAGDADDETDEEDTTAESDEGKGDGKDGDVDGGRDDSEPTAPEPTAPESTAPESTSSETGSQESSELGSVAPETASPEPTSPDTTAPEDGGQ